jgi:hypothetical protein
MLFNAVLSFASMDRSFLDTRDQMMIMCMYLISFSLQTDLITLALLKDNFGDANWELIHLVATITILKICSPFNFWLLWREPQSNITSTRQSKTY